MNILNETYGCLSRFEIVGECLFPVSWFTIDRHSTGLAAQSRPGFYCVQINTIFDRRYRDRNRTVANRADGASQLFTIFVIV